MKFWCTSSNSSKQKKIFNKKIKKLNDSFLSSSSSSVSYATISSSTKIPKSDSGFSETTSIIQIYSYIEEILTLEKIYYENLKNYIIKYSRPLRRYLNSNEILYLFQNIEKISTISQSFIRQYQKLFITDNIYQSWFDIMIDSYNSYISGSLQAHMTLKQCQNRITYFLQIPIEIIIQEITEFILLPLRHICMLNDLFRQYNLRNMNEDIYFLSRQAKYVLQNDQISILELSQDITLQSEIAPIVVFQRTDKEPWKSKRLELSNSRLSFTELDESSFNISICLSNIVHIEEDFLNEELRLIVASTMRKSSQYSSFKMKRVYIRFEDKNDYYIWLDYLRNAIQDAKDQSWSKTHEIVI